MSSEGEKKAINTLIATEVMMQSLTGGKQSFIESLFPTQKPVFRSLCDNCLHNFKKPSFCQSCYKTWHNTTDIRIKTCSGYEPYKERNNDSEASKA